MACFILSNSTFWKLDILPVRDHEISPACHFLCSCANIQFMMDPEFFSPFSFGYLNQSLISFNHFLQYMYNLMQPKALHSVIFHTAILGAQYSKNRQSLSPVQRDTKSCGRGDRQLLTSQNSCVLNTEFSATFHYVESTGNQSTHTPLFQEMSRQ